MYHFFKNNRVNKYFVYFLLLSFFNSGYFAYSNELMKNYIKFKLNPQAQNRYVGNSFQFFNPSDVVSNVTMPEIPNGNIIDIEKELRNTISSVVYTSDLKEGKIGMNKKGDSDLIYDNIFKININENNLVGKEVYLTYDIKGIDKSTLPSRSVNFNKVVGGYVVKFSNEWQNVEEKIDNSWLKNGLNTIFFTLPEQALYSYSIKNLKISVKEKVSSNHIIELKNLIGYKDNDKNIYLNGFIAIPNQFDKTDYTLSANDKLIKITDNQFEDKLTDVNYKDIELKLFKNNVLIDKVDIKVNQFIKADRNYDLETLDSKINSNTSIAKNYVEYETKKYTIEELRLIDIPQFESNFINVTKNKTAYRVNDLKVKDSTAFKLFMEYNSLLIPNGYTEKDVQTFRFDSDYKKWLPVEKDTLIKSSNVIVTLSDKGGDYVNGIIQTPESPQTSSFTPTMMSDIKAADPTSGMTLISPPEVSQKGGANIGYPIKIPSGRNGMQPSVSINYNSDGGNGWLGEGWGVIAPAITLDTKWGVPTFDQTNESEIYMLNGEQLMYPKLKLSKFVYEDWMPNRHILVNGNYQTIPQARGTIEKQFTPRKQGSFAKIERKGQNPTNYYWKVTSTDGTVSWYGGKNNVESNAVIKNAQNNIVHWSLYRVEDVNGNTINYYYNNQIYSGGTGVNENLNDGLIYNLSSIKYTGYNGSDGAYSIDFINENSITRPDISIHTRLGLKQIIPYRLDKIKVSYNNNQIRGYKLEYALGKFEKTILNKVIEQDNNNVNLYEHTFDYYNDIADNVLYEKSREESLPNINPDYLIDFNPSYLNTSQKTEFSWDVRPAIGLEWPFYKTNKPNRSFTIGAPFGESYQKSKGKVTFSDINGDGLDDILYKKNDKLYYQPRLNSEELTFGSDVELQNINEYYKSNGKTKTMFGESFDFMLYGLYMGKKRFKSKETTSIYLNDSNGDNLPDIVRDGVVYFNNGANTFETSSENTPNMLITADVYQQEELPDPEPELNDFDYTKYDVVRIWEAPYDGNITISDYITFNPTTATSSSLYTIETQFSEPNSIPFRVYLKEFNSSVTTDTLEILNYSGNNPPLGNNTNGLYVKKGQKFFFRVRKNTDSENDILSTSPVVNYIGNDEFTDANGYSTKVYDHSVGFKLDSDDGEVLIEESGNVKISWDDIPLNLTDDVKFKITYREYNEQGSVVNESVMYDYDYSANTNSVMNGETIIQNFIISNGKANIGFYFDVISDSNVNWNIENWYPKFEFTPSNTTSPNAFIKYAIPTHTIYQEANDVNIRNLGTSLQSQYNFKCTNVNYQGTSSTNTYYVKPISPSTVSNPYSFISTDNGFFIFVVKKNGTLLGKRKIAIVNGAFSFDDETPIAFVLNNSSELSSLSFEYYVDDKTNLNLFYKYTNQVSYDASCGTTISGFNFITNAANIIIGTSTAFANGELTSPFSDFRRVLIHPNTNLNYRLGGMHRNWGQFIYNSSFNANTNIPSDIHGKLIDIADLTINENQLDFLVSGCESFADPNDSSAYEDCVNNSMNSTLNLPADGTINSGNVGQITEDLINNPALSNLNFNLAFMSMFAKIELDQNNTRRWICVFQNEYSQIDTVNCGSSDALSFPEDYFGNEGSEAEPLQPDSFTGMFGVNKEHRSVAVSYSAGYGMFNASNSNSRYSNLLSEFIDINGDNYPDVLTTNSFYRTMMTGGHRDWNSPFGIANASSNDNYAMGLSRDYPIAGRGGTKTKKQDNGKPTFSAGLGLSLNLGGANTETQSFIDINGDGLVDIFNLQSGNKIKFNYGNSFSSSNENFNYAAPVLSKPSPLNAPSINLGFSGNGSVPFSVSVGMSSTSGNTNKFYIDINGDSLPDLLTYDTATAYVRFNLGNKFSDTPISIKYDTISPLLSMLNNNKLTSLSAQGSFSKFWGRCIFYLWIPIGWFVIPIPLVYFKAGFTLGGSANLSISENNREFRDMNADGFIDFVQNNDNLITVYKSRIARTNKLKTVINPIGGSFTVDYAVQPVTFDNPHAKWAMSSVTVNDGRDLVNDGVDSFTKTFKYENGKYDRRERAFYGYETVEIHEVLDANTTRKSVTKYHNSSYFLEGLVKESAVYKVSNNVSELFSKSENTYQVKATNSNGLLDINGTYSLTFDVGGKEGRRQAGVLLTKTVKKAYEFGTTPLTSEIEFKYDGYGRVEQYTYKGDITNPNDDYKSVITYQTGLNNNLISIPKKIQVFTGATFINLVREREITSVNANTGAILSLKSKLNSTDFAVTNMTYDVYGNLKTVAGPSTAFGQMTYTYHYDTTLNKYLIGVEDAFGYQSSSLYDYNFDVVKKTTDIAGNEINYDYDNLGRLTKIIAPKEAGNSNPYTISFAYMPTYAQVEANELDNFVSSTNFIPFAVTKHYDAQHPTDPIETINFVDGLGSNIQVKKDIEVNTGTSSSPTYNQLMSVSGYVTNDVWGRVIKTYQPRSEGKDEAINYLINQAATPNTSFNEVEYDVLDRTTKTTDMEGNVSVMSYAIANDPFGTLSFKTKSIVDQNASAQLINESFTDINGRNISTLNAGSIKTKFNYDAIGQLMSYTDDQNISTSYTYDLAGRKLQVNHPDNGITNYVYDVASNLRTVQTANLIAQNKFIEYYYDINRVTLVKYPDLNGVDNIANVTYEYGEPNTGNSSGRLIKQTDATGQQEFEYGNMGEMLEVKRTIVAPNLPTRIFTTKFNYDSFNRIQNLTYPDGEQVSYFYNLGGNLNRMSTLINDSEYDYIKQIDYDYFEQKTYMKYGNNTETFYNYTPEQRRLDALNVKASDGQDMFNNVYSYDKVGNVIKIKNNATYNTGNYMGGIYQHDYDYDNLNRLSSATGSFTGFISRGTGHNKKSYSTSMTYNSTHGIIQKKQTHTTQGYVPIYENTYNNNYDYQNGSHKVIRITNVENNSSEYFDYDSNGNMIQNQNDTSNRRMYWDEANRLRVVNDTEQAMQHYIYDGAGERVLKASSEIESVYENGQIDGTSTTMGLYTTYVSPYMVVDADQKYSKHYFNGSQRVVSRIGDQTVEIFEESQLRTALAKNQNDKNETESTTDFDALKAKQIADFNYYLGQNTTASKKVKVKYQEYKKVDKPVENTTAKGAEQQTQAEPTYVEMFYYHSDHLGTGAFLSDTYGNPYQFFLNLPFGETMMEQHSYTGDYTNRYKFNGKELDEETGFYYYGARYYNPKFSIWLSVDPLAEKYPNFNAYSYCYQNPIKYIDPTGMEGEGWIEEVTNGKSTFTYRDGIDTVQQAKDAGFTNAVGVTQAHKVWNDSQCYSYRLNENGSVSGNVLGNDVSVSDSFTTKGGTTIVPKQSDNYFDFYNNFSAGFYAGLSSFTADAIQNIKTDFWTSSYWGNKASDIFSSFYYLNEGDLYWDLENTISNTNTYGFGYFSGYQSAGAATSLGFSEGVGVLGNSFNDVSVFSNASRSGFTIFKKGKDFRIDLDVRNGLHYHRRGPGGIGRHRPWQSKPGDNGNFFKRF